MAQRKKAVTCGTPVAHMARCMLWRNLLLHVTRNSPRHTNKYYHRLIEIIGKDTWDRLDPFYKNAWNNARNSFDAMYGLAAAWKETGFPLVADLEPNVKKPEPSFDPSPLQQKLEQLHTEAKKLQPAEASPWREVFISIHAALSAAEGTQSDALCDKTAAIQRLLTAHTICVQAQAASIKEREQ